ncbi:MAG: prepilin-type N-terminal cleavage/methylation domain-containing protein [bacterium]
MNKKGLTLIELLIAASIFLIFTAALAAILQMAKTSTKTSQTLIQNQLELTAQAEALKQLSFAEVKLLNKTPFADGGEINVTPISSELVRIKLTLGDNQLETLKGTY